MRSSECRLYLCDSADDAWHGAISPWLQRVTETAWQEALPVLVVTPTRGQAQAIKQRLVAERRSSLGIRFLTPPALRYLLRSTPEWELAPPEHARLLLSVAAEEHLRSATGERQQLAAKAVMRAPDHLLSAAERLDAAGWEFGSLRLAAIEPIVERFRQLLRECGFRLRGEYDRMLASSAADQPPQFADVLLTGFDGAHWPLWNLLQAATHASMRSAIVLNEPRVLDSVQTCWIDSWEQTFGEAQRISAPRSDELLFPEDEMRGAPAAKATCKFLVGENAPQQAAAIAQCCVDFLAQQSCTNVAVVFPERGALPRLVSAELGRVGIAHNDSLAHPVPGIFESADWRAWIELQRNPRLKALVQFFNALPNAGDLFADISPQQVEQALRRAHSELLIDDLRLLALACAESSDPRAQAAARVAAAFTFLPERSRLPEFIEQTIAVLRQFGWHQHEVELASRIGELPQRFDGEITRTVYLRWLDELAISSGAERAPAGDHLYAPVQLLTLAEAQGREWSHVVVAGSNEGLWPPTPTGEFAREHELTALNREAQQLNRGAMRRGRFGEGHTAVRTGYSLYLGPAEQRTIAQSQVEALLESTGTAVAFTASLMQESAPERLWNPSELFTRRYRDAHREPLTQGALIALQRATATWLVQAKPPAPRPDIAQTLVAFNSRRDASRPAGEYDFALRPNESARTPPILSVSDIEAMVKTPALVWLKRYLGVESPDESSGTWAAATGKWVHAWLANLAVSRPGTLFAALPGGAAIDERIRICADEQRQRVERLCDSLGRRVPDWWSSGWLNARYLARHLAARIAGVAEWKWIATELPIGRDGAVQIAPDISLSLRGQIDLVLAKNDSANFEQQAIWIIDYKTGATEALKPTDLHDRLVKGTVLQLGLYALAVRTLGAASVAASIISPAVKKIAPQIAANDFAPHEDVFAELAKMQQTGFFGLKGDIRPGYGACTAYPLATLPIDVDVLEDKWAMTHPALVLEKEEWEVW